MFIYEFLRLSVFVLLPALAVLFGALRGLASAIAEHRRPPLGALILSGMGVVLLLCSLALSLLAEHFQLYFYWLGMGLRQWQFCLRVLLASCLLFGGLLFAVRRVLSWKTLVLGVLLGGWLFVLSLGMLFMQGEVYYTEMTSPEKGGEVHELVFEEVSFLMGGNGTVYEKVSPCFMKKLGNYVNDDGLCTVYHDYCDFEWREDGFTMSVPGLEREFQYAP